MILIFYNENMDVCIYEYKISDGVLTPAKKDIFYDDTDSKLFKERLDIPSYFMNKVLLDNQSRFSGHKVVIFDNLKSESLYDKPELMDMLYLYRREITILKAEVVESEIDMIAGWLFNHAPK